MQHQLKKTDFCNSISRCLTLISKVFVNRVQLLIDMTKLMRSHKSLMTTVRMKRLSLGHSACCYQCYILLPANNCVLFSLHLCHVDRTLTFGVLYTSFWIVLLVVTFRPVSPRVRFTFSSRTLLLRELKQGCVIYEPIKAGLPRMQPRWDHSRDCSAYSQTPQGTLSRTLPQLGLSPESRVCNRGSQVRSLLLGKFPGTRNKVWEERKRRKGKPNEGVWHSWSSLWATGVCSHWDPLENPTEWAFRNHAPEEWGNWLLPPWVEEPQLGGLPSLPFLVSCLNKESVGSRSIGSCRRWGTLPRKGGGCCPGKVGDTAQERGSQVFLEKSWFLQQCWSKTWLERMSDGAQQALDTNPTFRLLRPVSLWSAACARLTRNAPKRAMRQNCRVGMAPAMVLESSFHTDAFRWLCTMKLKNQDRTLGLIQLTERQLFDNGLVLFLIRWHSYNTKYTVKQEVVEQLFCK